MPVAEVGGESSAEEVHAIDQLGVDEAERALEALQVERLVQLEAVEHQGDVAGLAAAYVERRRVVLRRDSGE